MVHFFFGIIQIMCNIVVMPLPTKKSDESKEEFMSRCMGDDIMNSEFSDSKQRAAVCNSQFEQRKKQKGTASWDDVRKGDVLGLL